MIIKFLKFSSTPTLMKERKVLAKVAHHRLRKNALLLTRLNACVHCSIFERVCASQDEIILKSRFFFYTNNNA